VKEINNLQMERQTKRTNIVAGGGLVTITVKDFLQNNRSEYKDYSALDEFQLKNENTVSDLRMSNDLDKELNYD
jgi:hypothetical protein